MSLALVQSTDPVALARGLMQAGLPYRWGFALVTALRLAPVFRAEAHHVYRAQRLRGVDYAVRGPRRYWRMLRRLCLPLLVSALRTAQSLSLSMEGRAFGLHPRRTFLRPLHAGRADVVGLALLALALAAATLLHTHRLH
jgi:energy-coupling factor transport system permease protein